MAKIDIKKEMARRLRAAREAIEPNRTEAARRHGWNYNTYKSHEDGSRSFGKEEAAIYSRAFKTSINHLLCIDLLTNGKDVHAFDSSAGVDERDSPAAERSEQQKEVEVFTVPVHGQAAGGLWLEGGDMPFDSEPVLVPALAGYPVAHQYARRVVGNSVNNRIADGDYAIFVRYSHYNEALKSGQLVDCQRSRAGLYEHTVKAFAGNSLMTDSRDLAEQIAIPLESDESDTMVEIVGVAIGAYRPLL